MDHPIDLKPFCGDSDIREFMNAPVRLGSYTYATNGHLLIRVDSQPDAMPPDNPDIYKKAIEKLEVLAATPPHTQSELDTIAIESIPCTYCNGTGHGLICPECDGLGNITVENAYSDYEVECKTCNGNTTISDDDAKRLARIYKNLELPLSPSGCSRCRSTGKIQKELSIPIGSTRFQTHMIEKFKTLPNAKIATFGQDDPGLITFTGGIALLMPIRE